MHSSQELILRILDQGVDAISVRSSLERRLQSGKKLRVYMGIDPSGSDLHLGHAVPLRKLRQFQELGHQVILLIGDYTARIGDPTGKSQTRTMLSSEQIADNMRSYTRQAGKILNMDEVEVRYNSEWYEKMRFADVLQLSSLKTVAQFLHRDDFKKRFESGRDISMVEFMYPLMQGYDSVMMEIDVELGGTDQTFNMLVSRDIQESYDQRPQDVITVPILEGLDGKDKMSKSLGNYIGLEDVPADMFGKVMSIPDGLIMRYFTLLTDLSPTEIDEIEQSLKAGTNPRDLKMLLAGTIVSQYHDADSATRAKDAFIAQFQRDEIPDDIPEFSIQENDLDAISLLVALKLVESRGDARRMIQQGAVKIDKERITSEKECITLHAGMVVQVGKRKFAKVVK